MPAETCAPPVTEEEIEHRFRDFAIRQISTCPDLHQQLEFPKSLWDQMRRHQLFGIGIDQKFGGQSPHRQKDQAGPYRLLSICGKALAANGGNLGICLSWLIHELTAFWLVQSIGTEAQKADWLPRLASGEATACLAISEPGVGAHPKHLSTTAKAIPEGFLLNGEKTYLTNGPMADLFIVVAVSEILDGKKRFSAFLVPRTAPGLTLCPALDFAFLHPAPHGGIVLKDCLVGPAQVLGRPGRAYAHIVLPFRTAEDTLMMGPLAGALTAVLQHLIAQLNRHQIATDDVIMASAAQLHCAAEALGAIAETAAELLDTGGRDEQLTALGLFFRSQASECLDRIREIIEKTEITPDQKLLCMTNDLSAAIRIAGNVSRIKLQKLGHRLFIKS